MRRLAPLLIYLWTLGWIGSGHFPGLPPGNDSCQYLASAQGFASGHPFSDPSSPVPGAGALLGPSFFPMLLSLYWLFAAPHLWILKLAVALVIGLAPVFAYLWLGLHVSRPIAALCALAFGASYTFLVQGNSIMTESVYCPLFHAALWLSQRTLGAGGAPAAAAAAGKPWTAMLLWVVLARTRVVGWFFFAAYALLAARRRWLGAAALGAGAAAAWVCLERFLARGVMVLHYTNNVFTRQFPILVDPWKGMESLAANFSDNLWSLASVIDAHMLWPWLYEAVDMNKAKRAACLAVFLWSAWGARGLWRDRPSLRPWLVAMAVSLVPSFLIFQPHDNFRYLMPLFPVMALAFLWPFIGMSRQGAPWRRSLPAAAALLLALGQALGSAGHDFDSEFIDYPDDYAALHDSLLTVPARPDLCLSPDFHYTWLRTGCPSLHMQSRHPLEYVRPLAQGKETWAICGPRNDYFCEEWERKGVVFGNPPLKRTAYWRLLRVESWPPADSAAPALR